MRFLMYAKTNGVEQLFYDSASVNSEMSIAQPDLKLELNKAGTLEFTLLPSHPMYNSFKTLKTYIRVMQDNDEIFRGRVLKIKDSIWLERNIQCEGDIAYLIDSYQVPQQQKGTNTKTTSTASNSAYRSMYGGHIGAKSSTVQSLILGENTNTQSELANQFRYYISQHNSQMEVEKQFTVGNVTVVDVGTVSFTSSNYRDTKNAIDGDLIDRYGGYLQTRKNPNGPTYIDWLKEPGTVSSQKIVLGVNMVDLQQESEGDELFTIFIPIGDDDLTIASVNDGKIGLEDTAKIAKYGKIYKTQSYSGIKDAAELKKLGQDYMEANCKPEKLTLTVKALDMNLLNGSVDAIKVGSTVTVISDPHGIETSLTCISIEYDIQNPENNSYEIGDASETLSHKAQLANMANAEATSSAKSRAGWASSAASDLGDTITRHAVNIIDQADATYKLEADLAQVHAKCIEITAEEKVTVTADTLELNTRGTIDVSAGGVIKMASTAQINFNDTLYIGSGIDDYTLYNLGSAWMQELTIGGHLLIADIEDENGAKWTNTSSLRGFLSIFSSSFIYGDEEDGQNLENAVKSFGIAVPDQTGQISIPYYTFSGGNTKAGDITFNMADTAWFIARAVKDLIATKESNTTQIGNKVSADFRLHARNAEGDDITSTVQTISLDFIGSAEAISDIIATKEGITTEVGHTVSAVFRLHVKNQEGDDITSTTQTISLDFVGVQSVLATKEGITTQEGNTVSAVFRLHAKNADGDDILSDTQTISLDFEGVDSIIATKEGDTTQSGRTVSAPFMLRAKDSNGNDIATAAQTISLDFVGVQSVLATKEGVTTQNGNTVSAVFRLHAKDPDGNDILSDTQTISLDFIGVHSVTATKETVTSQSGNTVSATFRLHAKDSDGNDILSDTQVISLDFTDPTISRLTATKEGVTTQNGNTVSAVFRLHAKDADGNDITSDTQTISLDFTVDYHIIKIEKSGTTHYSDNKKTVYIPARATDSNGGTYEQEISSSIKEAYDFAYKEGWSDALDTVVLDPSSDTTISSAKTVYAKGYLTPEATALSTLASVKITPTGGSTPTPGTNVVGTVNSGQSIKCDYTVHGYEYEWMPVKYGDIVGYMQSKFISMVGSTTSGTNWYENRINNNKDKTELNGCASLKGTYYNNGTVRNGTSYVNIRSSPST